MTKQEQFESWAKEISNTWTGGYAATASENGVTVTLDGVPVAEITYKLYVIASDTEVESQLKYMINR